MTSNEKAFLAIVKIGIGTTEKTILPSVINWSEIKELADKQGLTAIVIDGIELLPEKYRPPKDFLLEWIGEVLQVYEYRYDAYQRTIAEMAGFYNSHGYKMMVLKGYACSLNWPKPEHRPCGDIDIWLFGKQKEADETLRQAKGPEFKIDTSHHHHTVFYWKDFMIENHYDFDNVHAHKSNAEIEKLFKELGKDDGYSIEVLGEKVYLPSPKHHVLFLLRHMAGHFAAAEINLRQVLDWGFFVKNHTNEIDWQWLDILLDKYHMREFFNLIIAISVEDLGFPADIFPLIQYLPSNKEKVLDDILEPAYTAAEPKKLLPRLIYKYKRWQGNAWKQEMCYGESRWDMFWKGIWAKLLKPASI